MSRRNHQDRYDVIQAREEFESMSDPRTKVLKDRIAELEVERDEEVASGADLNRRLSDEEALNVQLQQRIRDLEGQ